MSINNIRVKVNKKYHHIYRELTTETVVHHKIFEQHGALFTLCAILGFRETPVANFKAHSFKGTDLFWSHSLDKYQETVIKAVAVRSTGRYDIIGIPEEIISASEILADLGMGILIENVLKEYMVDGLKDGEYSLEFSNVHHLEKLINMFIQEEMNKNPLMA